LKYAGKPRHAAMVINERLMNEEAILLRPMGFALSPWNQYV
jgi:hypothetical protein